MQVYLFIALGGAIGACCRFGLGYWVQTRSGSLLPWGTFTVNVLGCLLIGVLAHLFDGSGVRDHIRLGITVGMLGALTTFSTFSLDTLKLLEAEQWRQAAGYVLGTNCACFLALWIGFIVTKRIHP